MILGVAALAEVVIKKSRRKLKKERALGVALIMGGYPHFLKAGFRLVIVGTDGVIIASARSDDWRDISLNDVFLGFPTGLSRFKGAGCKLKPGLVGANRVAIIIDANLVGIVAGFVLATSLLISFGAADFGHTQSL